MESELLTVAELAAYTKHTKATVYQWNHAGTGPRRIQVGKHVLYRKSDVDAWLESLAIEPKAAV